MPKQLKKFEHKKQTRSNFESKYDWVLLLSGKDILMEKGADYDAEGERATDAKDGSYKKGDKYDRTDTVMGMIRIKADEAGKSCKFTKVNAQGQPDTENVAGFVVTAKQMTPEEIAERDKRRAERKSARAATEANGTQTHAPEAAVAVAPE